MLRRLLFALTVIAFMGQAADAACSNGAFRQRPVRVMTSKLQPVDGLTAKDFVVTDKRRRTVEVCGVTHFRQAISLGIVVDTSGSMRELDGPRLARVAIEHILETGGPQDEYFLVASSDYPKLSLAFTRSLAPIRAAIPTKAGGGTQILDAISMAAVAMRDGHHPNKALLVISDGADNQSAETPQKVEQALLSAESPMFLLMTQWGWKPPRDDKVSAKQSSVMGLASVSGGHSFKVATPAQVLETIAGLANLLRAPYFIQVPQATRSEALRIDVGVRPRPLVLYPGRGY